MRKRVQTQKVGSQQKKGLGSGREKAGIYFEEPTRQTGRRQTGSVKNGQTKT